MKGACFKLKVILKGPYHDAVWGASYADLTCLIYRDYGTRDDPFSISKVKFQVLSHPAELGLV